VPNTSVNAFAVIFAVTFSGSTDCTGSLLEVGSTVKVTLLLQPLELTAAELLFTHNFCCIVYSCFDLSAVKLKKLGAALSIQR
jgi:hypothetical protein